MFDSRLKNKKGFTLIELLVVISIIGLLSTVAMTSLNSARAKARDTKKIMELKQFQQALRLCYAKRGSYFVNGETTVTTPCGRESFRDSDFVRDWGVYCGEFMSTPPVASPAYIIHTSSDYQHFVLLAQLESSQYAMTSAEVTGFVQALVGSSWIQCAQYNYVIGE
jgi:prepilin-type N-terminal cleavage/methylation domain-containing protein